MMDQLKEDTKYL